MASARPTGLAPEGSGGNVMRTPGRTPKRPGGGGGASTPGWGSPITLRVPATPATQRVIEGMGIQVVFAAATPDAESRK